MSDLVPISNDEDTFCLAVIECGGNFAAAYRQAFNVTDADGTQRTHAMRARELMARPEIAKRVLELQRSVDEHSLISLGSHLGKLAEIRDLAIESGQLKTALGAEQARGQVAGYYQTAASKAPPSTGAVVNINLGSSPATVQDWASQHGKAPIIIDVPAQVK